jgi:hypothetical protein
MELQTVNNITAEQIASVSTELPFILANTSYVALDDIRSNHIIPVFVKDNEPVISHHDFVGCTQEVISHVFKNEVICQPSLRVSHPIKGRIPEAKDKPARELFEHEKTIYYERMAFVIEVPSIRDTINGNELSLTIGGVKAYNTDNLYSRKGTDEHFKVFIGFQNKVCCNMCVWSDGFVADMRVKSTGQLMKNIFELVTNYRMESHPSRMTKLVDYELTEHQFATLIGRSKLYQYLPSKEKRNIPELKFGDNQIGIVAKDYYKDESFCREEDGSINPWNVYNLFTGANKQSYIDTFLDRGLNAFQFATHLESALQSKSSSWFLS